MNITLKEKIKIYCLKIHFGIMCLISFNRPVIMNWTFANQELLIDDNNNNCMVIHNTFKDVKPD